MTGDPNGGFDFSPVGEFLNGRYRVTSALGEGGMGKVYLATDEHLDRPVVLKVPHVALLASPEFRQRFEREVRSLIHLDHPHVVKVHDVGVVRGVPFVVLQYLQGGNLEDRMHARHGRFTANEVMAWLPDIASALDYCHGKGFVHRDVKPGNIMFDDDGHAFLGDFGVARALGDSTSGITRTGVTPGSPRYMAPEAALGRPLGPAYDQYSLAVVVYRALSGSSPHDAPTPLALMTRKAIDPPQALGPLVPEISAAAAQAVMRGLALRAEDRHASCAAFARAFATGLRAPIGAGTDPTEVDGSRSSVVGVGRRRARRRWLTGVALAATAVVALAAVAWRLRPSSARTRRLDIVTTDTRSTTPLSERPDDARPLEAPRSASPSTPPPASPASPAPSLDGASEPAASTATRGDDASAALSATGSPSDAPDITPPAAATQRDAALASPASTAGPIGDVQVSAAPLPSSDGVGRSRDATTRDAAKAAARSPTPATDTAAAPEPAGSKSPALSSAVAGGGPPATSVGEPRRPSATKPSPLDEHAAAAVEVARFVPPPPPAAASPAKPVPALRILGANARGFETFERTLDGARVVLVPGGQFALGSTGGDPDEQPVHAVTLSPFLIDEREVTWAQYALYRKAHGIQLVKVPSWNPGLDHPATNLTWDMAADYCAWVGARLPTEAEWEAAARGPAARTYPWGDAWRDGAANWADDHDGFPNTAPVGSFATGASPYGLLDMAGNAAEWVADWYATDAYLHAAERNPRGPSSGESRVYRGGSFNTKVTAKLRATDRAFAPPSTVFANFGVRCAQDR